MIDILRFIFISILYSAVFLIPGLLINDWLAKEGYIRSDRVGVIICTIVIVFIKRIWFDNIAWWLWVLAMIIGMTFGVHRGDLSATIRKGKWWWKSKSAKAEKL